MECRKLTKEDIDKAVEVLQSRGLNAVNGMTE